MRQPNRAILIPIRLASERLPGKALLDVGGKPALHHLLERCLACRYVEREQIVVCTTHEPTDDKLVTAVEAWGAKAWRGPTHDLIRRLSEAVEALQLDHVVGADGDCLFCATEYMDLCFEALAADPDLDAVTCEGLPLGIACRAYTREAIRKVMAICASERNDTAYFHYFTQTGICRHLALQPVAPGHRHDTARVTLDYPEDLSFFRRCVEELRMPGRLPSLSETVEFLAARPDLVAINSQMTQHYRRRQTERAQLKYRDAGGILRDIAV